MAQASILYSIPYAVLFILFFIIGIKEYLCDFNDKKKYYLYSLILFVSFYGLRGLIAWDWQSYKESFELITPELSIQNIVESSEILKYEYGYTALIILLKNFVNSYYSLIFIFVLLDSIFLFAFFKRYSVSLGLSFAFFVLTAGEMELNLLRNVRAILIFLVSLKYIEERNPIKYFSLIILASLFHASSVVFFPLYFILTKKINKNFLFSFFIIGNVFYLFKIRFLTGFLVGLLDVFGVGSRLLFYIQFYVAENASEAYTGISLGYIERFITTFILIYFYNEFYKSNRISPVILNSYFVYFFFHFFCTEIPMLVERVANCDFVYPYWIIWPFFITLSKIHLNKYVILLLFLYSILKISVFYSSPYYKYDNLIWGIHSPVERENVLNQLR